LKKGKIRESAMVTQKKRRLFNSTSGWATTRTQGYEVRKEFRTTFTRGSHSVSEGSR